jgi:hypothetical protein
MLKKELIEEIRNLNDSLSASDSIRKGLEYELESNRNRLFMIKDVSEVSLFERDKIIDNHKNNEKAYKAEIIALRNKCSELFERNVELEKQNLRQYVSLSVQEVLNDG